MEVCHQEIKYLDKNKIMEFSIGPQFSREFSYEDGLVVSDLTNFLNKCFAKKKYNSETQKIYIGVICVSKGFEPFFIARPLKVLRNESAIEYEIKLEYEPFFKANFEERIKILYSELLNQSKEILNNKKLKNFKRQEFLEDLQECLSLNSVG